MVHIFSSTPCSRTPSAFRKKTQTMKIS
jgi:hypothetical protein